jgi:DNA adenine methylase
MALDLSLFADLETRSRTDLRSAGARRCADSGADVTESPRRPALRWHGGKWLLAPWIISHFPAHRIYVEPFGGGGSVLLRKPRSYGEIWNDLDDDVVNMFKVLRSNRSAELVEALRLTPFSRTEFEEAYGATDDPVEKARRLVIRCFMGFGSNGHSRKTGFRANSNRSGTTPAHDWINYPDSLVTVIERLSGVVIEKRDAKKVMLTHDSDQTLHYVDPPYVFATRSDLSKDYSHEMTDADHVELIEFLKTLKGAVVLSGYANDIYERIIPPHWHCAERASLADGAKKRVEVLWINRCVDVEDIEREAEYVTDIKRRFGVPEWPWT